MYKLIGRNFVKTHQCAEIGRGTRLKYQLQHTAPVIKQQWLVNNLVVPCPIMLRTLSYIPKTDA